MFFPFSRSVKSSFESDFESIATPPPAPRPSGPALLHRIAHDRSRRPNLEPQLASVLASVFASVLASAPRRRCVRDPAMSPRKPAAPLHHRINILPSALIPCARNKKFLVFPCLREPCGKHRARSSATNAPTIACALDLNSNAPFCTPYSHR